MTDLEMQNDFVSENLYKVVDEFSDRQGKDQNTIINLALEICRLRYRKNKVLALITSEHGNECPYKKELDLIKGKSHGKI